MSNAKNTKRSLIVSGLSLAVSCALLLGSTFAWFTDSVVNSNNRIASGELDVDLLYKTGETYASVQKDTNLFKDNALWEPGYAEAVNLKVKNLGSLALEYRLSVNIVNETESVNVNGDPFKLSDYIQFAVIDGEQIYATGAEAVAAAEAAGPTSIAALDVNETGVLYPDGKGTSEEYVTLVVYMPETVGNEANYAADAAQPQIDLGVNLTATQTPYETDGFGNDQYDADAAYADVYVADTAALMTAIENAQDGDIIGLNADFSLEQQLALDKEIVLELNGKTITIPDNADLNTTPIRVNAGGKLTITGDGVIDATDASDDVVPVSAMGGELIIQEGTIQVDTPNESCVYAMYGGTVTITGGTFVNNSTEDYAYGDGAPLTLNVSNGNPGTITVTGGTFQGRNPADGDDNLGGTFVAAGYQSTQVAENTYIVTPADTTPVISRDGLADALQDVAVAGNKDVSIQIAQDVADVTGIKTANGNSLKVDFGGNTVSVAQPVGSAGTETNGMQLLQGSMVTLKNGTYKPSSSTVQILVQNYSDLTLEDVTLDGTSSSNCGYIISSNCGDVVIKGDTDIIAPAGKIALDVMHWEGTGYEDEGTSITFDETMTGTVDGKIEVYCQRGGQVVKPVEDGGATLTIKGGTFMNTGLTLEEFKAFVPAGYVATETADGVYTVTAE